MRYKFHIDPTDGQWNLARGLRAQLSDRTADIDAGATHRGWKAGFGTEAAMAKLGTTGPLVGYLTERTLLESGAAVEIGGWGKAVLEAEVAVKLGSDLAAGVGAEVAAAAIDEVAAAIELVDLGELGSNPEAILATNSFHRHYLLGEFLPIADRAALDATRIDVLEGSTEIASSADPRDVLGDLAVVISDLADLLALGDEGLRAGDMIITGAAIPALTLSGGEQVTVRLAASEVSVSVAEVGDATQL